MCTWPSLSPKTALPEGPTKGNTKQNFKIVNMIKHHVGYDHVGKRAETVVALHSTFILFIRSWFNACSRQAAQAPSRHSGKFTR